MKAIVLGAGGQLGQSIHHISVKYSEIEFQYFTSSDCNICEEDAVEEVLKMSKPDYLINCAAYTAVDFAEKEQDKAYEINAEAVGILARLCKKHDVRFIHISTDYVFNGESELSYDEEHFTDPTSVYGASKLSGEEKCLEENPNAVIIRTSWVYSPFGKNFVKTMLKLFSEREELSVVEDQKGQPTYAPDLAEAICEMMLHKNWVPGIYHYSNYGKISWFEFAEKIKEISQSKVKLKPIPTSEYPTPAKRPLNSTLDLDKMERVYGIEPKYWENSLQTFFEEYHV